MKKHGLPKANRLRKRGDYILAAGEAVRRLRSGCFLLIIRPNGRSESRLGITVTRKIGKAVVRNRLKRQVREFFRLNRQLLPPGQDMVVIARQGAVDLSSQYIQARLSVLISDPQP
ncbi:MAG: ribonuclease P protein component [Thermodesulfobacteriota bacterium]